MAIGTSTSRETLEKKMCCKQRLAERFPVIVTGDEVVNGKPAPDIYLEVAARMGVNPEECLVVEDAPAGFQVQCLPLSKMGVPPSSVLLSLARVWGRADCASGARIVGRHHWHHVHLHVAD